MCRCVWLCGVCGLVCRVQCVWCVVVCVGVWRVVCDV